MDVSTNPSMNFTANSSAVCAPGESYIVFTPATLDSPVSTEFNVQIYGDAGVIVLDTIFNQNNPLPDTLFFNLNQSSCGFNFDGTGLTGAINGRYFITASADNDCAQTIS